MQVSSTSFRAYALDLWGFGDTNHKKNEEEYKLDEQVDLLKAFLGEMGIGKVAIVGHGLGALVGMKYAISERRSVDRVMAINCPLSFDAVSPRMRTSSPQELSDWLSTRSPEAATALSDAPKADAKAIARSVDDLRTSNLFENFRSLDVPCLLVYGDKDQAITAPAYETTSSTFTHQVVLDGSGHFPMIEETIKFNRLLTDFLTLDSGVSPSELQMKEEWKRRVR